MSSRGARLNTKYIRKTREICNDKCVVCGENIRDKKGNRRKVCSKCANDCLGGQWGLIESKINKRIKKEIKFALEVEEE